MTNYETAKASASITEAFVTIVSPIVNAMKRLVTNQLS